MSYQYVRYAEMAPLAVICLNRPDSLNAFTPEVIAELDHAIRQADADPSLSVVVLRGAGRGFSAGVDLKFLQSQQIEDGEVGEIFDRHAQTITQRIAESDKIFIAMVHGFCFTGALELAMACDLIVVADNTKLGDTHTKWAVKPSWGMSQRLPRLVGITRARELSFTARTFSGKEALDMGLAVAAPPPEELENHVMELAQQIAGNSSEALAAYKDLYRKALDCGLAEGLTYEQNARYALTETAARLDTFGK